MSYQEERLQEIADAIREVEGTEDKIPANQFASRVAGLSVVKPSGIKTITENGDYDVSNYAWASVNVEPKLRERDIIGKWVERGIFVYEFKENGIFLLNGYEGTYTILGNTIQAQMIIEEPDMEPQTLTIVFTYNRDADTLVRVGDDGLEYVSTRVPITLITKEITENGTYKASDDGADGYSEVVVNVAGGGKPSPFADATPEEIQQIGNEISAKGMTSAEVEETYGWKIGDIKDITLTTGEVIQMRIIGFNHDNLTGGGTAGITLEMVNCLNIKYQMNGTASTSGGWNSCRMRITTLPTIKSTLPTEWQNIIKMVNKNTASGQGKGIVTSSDDLFLLSEIEIFKTVQYAQKGTEEGSVYEFYSINNANAGRIKNIQGTAGMWWCRSCHKSLSDCYIAVSGGGAEVAPAANNTYGVSFAFCVGSKPVPVVAGLPIEVTTDTDMTNALTEDNLGKVYKFTGTSETYETDAIYIVSEV